MGSAGTFPSAGKYTLDPLRAAGPSSLVCIDVPGIEQIRLRELHLLWPTNGEVEVRKAPDVFEALKARGYELPERADIIQAAFQVKFADRTVMTPAIQSTVRRLLAILIVRRGGARTVPMLMNSLPLWVRQRLPTRRGP